MFCWHTTAIIITLSVVLIASVIISEPLWIEASVKSDVHEPPSIPAGPSPALEPEKIRKHRSGLHLQRNTAITSSSSITRRFLRRSQPEPERDHGSSDISAELQRWEMCDYNIWEDFRSVQRSHKHSHMKNRTEGGYLTHSHFRRCADPRNSSTLCSQLWWRSVSLRLNWSSSSRWTSGLRQSCNSSINVSKVQCFSNKPH